MGQQRRDLLYGMRSFERGKLVSARDAVQLIQDGDTVATTGFVGIGFPENIAVALEQRFLETSEKDPASGALSVRPWAVMCHRTRVTAA